MVVKPLSILCVSTHHDLFARLADALQPTYTAVDLQQANQLDGQCLPDTVDLVVYDRRGATQQEHLLTPNVPMMAIVEKRPKLPKNGRHAQGLILEYCCLEDVNPPLFGLLVHQLLERHQLHEQLTTAQAALQERSIRDELTGLYNKRCFLELFGQMVKKAHRYKTPLSLLMIDLDQLRQYNAEHGHTSGDEALCEVGHIVQHTIREVDLAARLDTDVFGVALPETSYNDAQVLAERIRHALHDYSSAEHGRMPLPNVSIGLTSLPLARGHVDDLLDTAEKALMAAKEAGGNRIALWDHVSRRQDTEWQASEKRCQQFQQTIAHVTDESRELYFRRLSEVAAQAPGYTKHCLPHAERVAFYADRLALTLGWRESERQTLRRGALLHDIGMIAMSERILGKASALDQTELELMRQHPMRGVQLLEGTLFLREELAIILHHHERYDGTGYPDHLGGVHIPAGARLVAIVEAWDRMIEQQPYRVALPLDHALQELQQGAGKQFDPELTKAFVSVVTG